VPWDRKLYPEDWEQIALKIKTDVGWKCQGCGRDCRRTGEAMLDFVERIEGSDQPGLDWVNQTALSEIMAHPQRWILGVAHLDHDPANMDTSNLKVPSFSLSAGRSAF
jgi:hypothetical protein